tara:strand:+ start:11605 stop:11958 length:354 start_codon:yes stop_codon:yes gene_type:complete
MKSWTCVEKCGACCKIDLKQRGSLKNILSKKDLKLIEDMTTTDGWCKYLDKSKMSCTIYENRPHFCRVNLFSIKFSEYRKNGDEFLINCCKDHINSIYGRKSQVMKNFNKEISNKKI